MKPVTGSDDDRDRFDGGMQALGTAGRARRLVAGWLVGLAAVAGGAAEGFRAGSASVDISPVALPVIVNGMFTERTASEVADPLRARALVLDDGRERLAIVVVDTCMVPRALVDAAKAEAHRATGIAVERMLISATHTHSAPAAMGCLGSRVDPRYAAFLPGRLAEAVRAAARRLEPAEVAWGVVDAWEHTFNRRWIRRPDRMLDDPFGQRTVRAHMHPGHESPDAVGPSGPVDPGLSVVAVRKVGGEPLAVLGNFSQHYYGSPLLSSDYFGRFEDHLRGMLHPDGGGEAFVGMMSQGTSGDLMWMDYGAPARDIGYDAYGREMAGKVASLYRGLRFTRDLTLGMAERRIGLGYRVSDARRLEWARRMADGLGERLPGTLPEIYALEALHLQERQRTELVLQAVRIGEVGMTAMPNEVYALTGLKLKARSPLPATFNISLANGAEGYIPPPEQHRLGGYTTWPARTAGLEVEAEPRIVETLLTLLEEVSGRPRRAEAALEGPYWRAVLASRPVAAWRLNEMDGSVARDGSGNGCHGAYEGGVALYLPGVGSGEGVSPRAALEPSAFSGPDGINRAPHFAGGRVRARVPVGEGDGTVVFWFWNGLPAEARGLTGHLLAWERAGRVEGLGIGGTDAGAGAGRLFFEGGAGEARTMAGRTELGQRRWHRVAMVRRGETVRVYLDDRREPEIEGRVVGVGGGGEATLLLGGPGEGDTGLEGKIDEVAVYDRALSWDVLAEQFRASGMPATTVAGIPTAYPPLSPEASLARIRVSPGYRVELVAAEPMVVDPVAFDWDAEGRLWVVEMSDYPLGMDGNGAPGGRIRVLEDTDGDGRYDRSEVFAEGLNFPTGVMAWRDGILVTAAPEVLFLRDTNGDGRADEREVLLTGFLEGNQQLRVNGLRWGLDGWVYAAAGGHHRGHGAGTVIRSLRAGREVAVGSRDLRFRPDTGELEPQSGPTQFGRNRDDWGRWFGTQNSWPLWQEILPDHYLQRNPHVAAPDPMHQILSPANPRVYPVRPPEKRYHSFEQAGHFTSACSGMIYRDRLLFAGDARPQAFVCEPVHNLVQRVALEDDGVSFRAVRVPGEEEREFLASDDPWWRPVMVRTGPDGALWVADMYRYMIEHPHWLPEEGREELLPHYREGDTRGRLYRVVPEGVAARRPLRLADRPVGELVAALESDNGWQRDMAHRMLLWRADPGAVGPLRNLEERSPNRLARLHALWVLQGLGGLEPWRVGRAMHDPHPGLRAQALRLAETLESPELVEAASRRVGDPDPKVRLQLAFSLGAWDSPRAGEALGQLAVANLDQPFLVAAVLSSVLPHARAVADAVARAGAGAWEPLAAPMIRMALGTGQRDVLARLVEPMLALEGERFEPWQMDALARFLDLLSREKIDWRRLGGSDPGDPLAGWERRAETLIEAAKAGVEDPAAGTEFRLAAASLRMHDPSGREPAMASLAAMLTPAVPIEVQRAALGRLTASGDAAVPKLTLASWSGHGPEIRGAILDALSSRASWAAQVLQEVSDGTLAAHAFDANRRTRLLQHGDRAVRERAQAVFSRETHTDRREVIERFRPALTLKGDAGRGRDTFRRLCVSCHRLGDEGQDVGPDLGSVRGHSLEKLLVNILDPNADVQPGYQAYSCTLRDGEELYGVIAAETANSVVLRLSDGSLRTVLRRDLAELHDAGISLMPEGLEADLGVQEMADLLAWLSGGDGGR
ncbi:MAG: c-type cytochrome [Verrucomicrobiae bacterium]|nr:c-type cytochrome [Verrucomicrobiae bacterium]